jgi:hypothetical protein
MWRFAGAKKFGLGVAGMRLAQIACKVLSDFLL